MRYRVTACLSYREEECERCKGDGRERISEDKRRMCLDCGGSGARIITDIRMDCHNYHIPRGNGTRPLSPYSLRQTVRGWAPVTVSEDGRLMLAGVQVKPGNRLEILVNRAPSWTVWVTGAARYSDTLGWYAEVMPYPGARAVAVLLDSALVRRAAATPADE